MSQAVAEGTQSFDYLTYFQCRIGEYYQRKPQKRAKM